jgi:hypothetical protein
MNGMTDGGWQKSDKLRRDSDLIIGWQFISHPPSAIRHPHGNG